jgi:hypothetical protein
MRKLRLYKFELEILDEPGTSDLAFETEVKKHLETYFEAFHLAVTLVEACDCITVEGDSMMADA